MTDRIEIDITDALKGLLDVAKVALTASEVLPREEAAELLFRLLAIVERTMPPELQAQDVRVMRAKLALDSIKQ